MDAKEYNFKVGEIVNLPRKSVKVNKSGMKSYEHLINSRYICVRECEDVKRGMLVKVLGKNNRDSIIISGGEPFFKDDKAEGFMNDTYYSYRFPSAIELKEILEIIRNDKSLIEKFEEASMHINPNSTYWVRDTTRRLLVLKAPQYYDVKSDGLFASEDDNSLHYRISVAYFYKSQISW